MANDYDANDDHDNNDDVVMNIWVYVVRDNIL